MFSSRSRLISRFIRLDLHSPRLLSTKHAAALANRDIKSPVFSHFSPGPAPPRLPDEQQTEFERLQKLGRGTFSKPPSEDTPEIEASPDETLHPDIRRGAPSEFEGEVNPKTGEVGGPKTDPLKWPGDWSYNGRVTDF